MKVIAIDPGVMTGFAYAEIEDSHCNFFPFQMTDDVDDLWRRLHKFEPRYIIIEDFEFRSGMRGVTGLNLFPVQLIGVTRLYELHAAPGGKCAVFIQKAAQGKAYYTDAVLKTMELYKRGVPHGMDATRHLLQWITFGAGFQFVQDGGRNFATLLTEWKEATENLR
jgi:hypothetical protein